MRRCLEEVSELVKENVTTAQKKQKNYYDKKSKPRDLKVGDEVRILEPARRSKLLLEWNGLHKVMRRVAEVDYKVQTPGRRRENKVYHVNLLKKWQKPETVEVFTTLDDSQEGHSAESCEEEDLEEFLLHTEKSSGDEDGIKVDTGKFQSVRLPWKRQHSQHHSDYTSLSLCHLDYTTHQQPS